MHAQGNNNYNSCRMPMVNKMFIDFTKHTPLFIEGMQWKTVMRVKTYIPDEAPAG